MGKRPLVYEHDDFYAYMPKHEFLNIQTMQTWTASSINDALRPKGEMKPSEWLVKYRPIHQIVWAPGEPQLIVGKVISQEGGWFVEPKNRAFNTYRPPIIGQGDANGAGPWLDHIKMLYPDEWEHIVNWFAHRVQRPGEKINHALVLGGKPGIGKDTILIPVFKAIGTWNVETAGPKDMMSDDWNYFIRSVILLINEAMDLGTAGKRYTFYEHMKKYTAAPPDMIPLKMKYALNQCVINVCGVVITTNYPDALQLPEDDRRYYVAMSEHPGGVEEEYFKELHEWYKEEGNRNVAAYLREVDLSEWNAKAPPPKTEGWYAMVDSGRSPESIEIMDLIEQLGNPDAVTIGAIKEISLKTGGELYEWLRDHKKSSHYRMKDAGYVPVRNPDDKLDRWFIGGKRQMIYAKRELPLGRRLEAARALRAHRVHARQVDERELEQQRVVHKPRT